MYAQISLFLNLFLCTLFNKRNDITKQWSYAFQLTPSLPLWVCGFYEWPPRDFLNASVMLNRCNIYNCKLSSFSAVSNKMSWMFDRFLCLHCLRLCFAHEGCSKALQKNRNILRFHKPYWCFQLWSFAADEPEVNFA